MKKSLKITLYIVLALFALIATAIALLPTLVENERFRLELIDQVKQHSGQDLRIEGNLKLSIFPWLGFRVEELALAQPSSLGDGDWFRVKSVDIKVKLLPLLNRQIEVNKVIVREPIVHFIVGEDGRNSLGKLNLEHTQSVDSNGPASPQPPNPSLGLLFAGASISEGDFLFENRQTGEKVHIRQLTIDAGNILSEVESPFSISALVDTQGLPETSLAFNTSLSLAIDQQTIQARDMRLAMNQPTAQRSVKLNLQQLNFSAIERVLTIDSASIQASMSIPEAKLDKLTPSLTIPVLTVDLKQQSLPPIKYLLEEKDLGLKVNGELSIKKWQHEIRYKGTVNTDTTNLQNVFEKLSLDYKPTDATALQNFKFSSSFNGGDSGASLKDITLVLDDSHMTGDISMIDFFDPNFRFDLSLDQINLDRYAPPISNEDAKSTEKKTNANGGNALAVPLVIFKEIPANGILRANKVQAGGVKMSDFLLEVSSNDQQVVIKPSAKLYQGKVNAAMAYREENNKAQLDIVSDILSVNLEQLLQDAGISDQIAGIGSIRSKVQIVEANGKQTQGGTVEVDTGNGALTGAGLLDIIDSIRNKINEECASAREKYAIIIDSVNQRCSKANKSIEKYRQKKAFQNKDKILFDSLSAVIALKDNILDNQTLTIQGDDFLIRGKGNIAIDSEQLDYTSTITLMDFDALGEGAQLSIPFRASGSLAKPEYGIDYKKLVKTLTENFKDQEKQKLKADAAKKLGINSDPSNIDKDVEDQIKDEFKRKLLDKLIK